jgi:hypothetical protein
MKALKFLIVALIFFVAGFFLGQSYQLPAQISLTNQANQQAAAPVTVIIQFADSQLTEFQNVAINQGTSVLELLQRLGADNGLSVSTESYEGLGVLVTAIGETINGQDNKYWQYFINGAMPLVGAGGYVLSGGERVEWKFAEASEEF